MNVGISLHIPLVQRLGHTDQKEHIWVPLFAWRSHGVCTGHNAEGGLAEEGGSICMGMGERGTCEVVKWVVVPQVFGDPETLAEKKWSLAHWHGFQGGSMVDTVAGLAGDKENIQERWEGGMVLSEWKMKLCPKGILGG